MESFVKTFYILNLGVNNPFGYEPDDEISRFNSALNYWKRFEEKADVFWRDALKITQNEDEQGGKEMLDKLFSHLNKKFQMFKIDDYTNVYVEDDSEK